MKKVVISFICFILVGVGAFFSYEYFFKKNTATLASKQQTADEKTSNEDETAKLASPLTEEEATATFRKLYDKLMNRIDELGQENGWSSSSNPADLETLQKGIEPYASKKFREAILPNIIEDLYCECDSFVMPHPDLDIRLKLVESKPDYFKVRTVDLADEISEGEQIFFTVKKENEKWKLDSFNQIQAIDKPLNITKEEAEKYIKTIYPSAKYLKEVRLGNTENSDKFDYDNGKWFLFYIKEIDNVYAVSVNDGSILYDVPEDVIPNFIKLEDNSTY
ncbi:hypothetical protein [Bacillus methanolicus]|uniref:Putative membrane protein n=1 Tax=Bacillus methanolicus (strain MGA3 / ATCC 53907) TaxID=796606 RepID=I3EB56_BACMM|nr:hypothetical protein [Bacillus methanolicus]AIE61408.1 putative membrane protein [Bacillus methanolicus MGA3]EIJ83727.1 hypothetical protein MGA3_00445 [Bacillus methanolicus MGA3]